MRKESHNNMLHIRSISFSISSVSLSEKVISHEGCVPLLLATAKIGERGINYPNLLSENLTNLRKISIFLQLSRKELTIALWKSAFIDVIEVCKLRMGNILGHYSASRIVRYVLNHLLYIVLSNILPKIGPILPAYNKRGFDQVKCMKSSAL